MVVCTALATLDTHDYLQVTHMPRRDSQECTQAMKIRTYGPHTAFEGSSNLDIKLSHS